MIVVAMVSLNLPVEVFYKDFMRQQQDHPNGQPFTIGLLIFITVEPVGLVDMPLLEAVSLDFAMEYDLNFLN